MFKKVLSIDKDEEVEFLCQRKGGIKTRYFESTVYENIIKTNSVGSPQNVDGKQLDS